MKTIQNLLETIKELISEATQNQGGCENMRLIPIPAGTSESNLPNNNNNR